MQRTLIVVGRPRPDRENMTSMLVTALTELNSPFIRVDGAPFPDDIPTDSVVAYFSSGPRFNSILEECRKRKLSLIVATTGIEAGRDVPFDVDIPVIMAPNLSLLIMALFKTFSVMGKLTQQIDARVDVVEGHQKTKTSTPGTAYKSAGYFGLPPEAVFSLRNDSVARALLGIPVARLGGFGSHTIAIESDGANANISFDTQGRSMYVPGLMAVYAAIEKAGGILQSGLHEAHELVFPSSDTESRIRELEGVVADLRERLFDRSM